MNNMKDVVAVVNCRDQNGAQENYGEENDSLNMKVASVTKEENIINL